MRDLNELDYKSIEIEGVNTCDYPDFVDAYISYACWLDGTELTDDELDYITSELPDLVYEKALAKFY